MSDTPTTSNPLIETFPTSKTIRDRLSALNLSGKNDMPSDARRILKRRLMPEIEKLEVLIDRDLSAWRA